MFLELFAHVTSIASVSLKAKELLDHTSYNVLLWLVIAPNN